MASQENRRLIFIRYDKEITLIFGDGEPNVLGEVTGDIVDKTIPCNLKSVDFTTQQRVTGETSILTLRVMTPYTGMLPDRARMRVGGVTSVFRIRRNPLHNTSSTFYIVRDD